MHLPVEAQDAIDNGAGKQFFPACAGGQTQDKLSDMGSVRTQNTEPH